MSAIEIEIAGRKIGPAHPPFIIAEMSGNHNQSLDRAFAMVDAAAEAGVHALKLQTFTPDTITLDVRGGGFLMDDPESPGGKRSLHELYTKAQTPWEWHGPIFERCRERGIMPFSAAFDETAVDFLESLGVPCHKIASFENVHLPLIRKAAAAGKPLFISTGMASVAELAEAVETARGEGLEEIILLKCASAYPADAKDVNLRTIPNMRELFGLQVGLSDHTMGLGVPLAAVALGATVIEKHFTLDRGDGGVDSSFSMEPAEARLLVSESGKAWRALGEASYGPSGAERGSMDFRRSLYVAEDMKAGDVFTEKNLRAVRPGHGLAPKYYDVVLGRRVKKDAPKGTPVSWDIVG
ncbi:MAG: pseudaminic acid synthase [Candidatus Nitrospinota bacterium M3_3B_026]